MTTLSDLDAVRALCNADLAENRFGYETCVAPNCSCVGRRQGMILAVESIVVETVADFLIRFLEGVKAAARADAADKDDGVEQPEAGRKSSHG